MSILSWEIFDIFTISFQYVYPSEDIFDFHKIDTFLCLKFHCFTIAKCKKAKKKGTIFIEYK